MSDVFLLYLFTRLDALQTFTWFASAVSAGLVMIFAVLISESKQAEIGRFRVSRNWAAVVAVVMAAVHVMVPDKEDAAIIFGGALVAKAVRSDAAAEAAGDVARVSGKALTVLEQYFDEQLKKK